MTVEEIKIKLLIITSSLLLVMNIYQKCTNCLNLIKQASLINWKYILNVLILLIALSRWILTFAISWVSLTGSSVNCPWLFSKGGLLRVHPRGYRRLFIVNPLSPITLFPLSSNVRIPDCLVISLSYMPPVYNWDMKVTLPEGAIPKSALDVVVLLYCENTWDCLSNKEGVYL